MSIRENKPLRGSLLALGVVFAFGACNSGGNTITNARCPCSLSAVSGDAQTGPPGAKLEDDLVVQVIDSTNQPILGATVVWRVVSGGGTIEPTSVGTGIPGESITDPGGFNSAEWTLGTAPGAQTVQVSTLVSADVVTFTATALTP